MSKPFVPFMERLTPAQKRKFRAGMARLRRRFEKQRRDAKRLEKQRRKARIMVEANAPVVGRERSERTHQQEVRP